MIGLVWAANVRWGGTGVRGTVPAAGHASSVPRPCESAGVSGLFVQGLVLRVSDRFLACGVS